MAVATQDEAVRSEQVRAHDVVRLLVFMDRAAQKTRLDRQYPKPEFGNLA